MTGYKPIPIGVEDFKEIINKEYYFVDKTLMIKDLLDNGSKISLFTRPRRFGKTLNMSMLQRFFEKTDEDNFYLFDGLKVAETGEKYLTHQGQYPVISLSLKSMKQATYDAAFYEYKSMITSEFSRHSAVLKSENLSPKNKQKFEDIYYLKTDDDKLYFNAIRLLSDCLAQAYNKNVIILIDEYDVPLENAFFSGFYEQMVSLIRSTFESALKTNPSLEFAVLTGCLRISKESIFTGLNNLDVYSILNNELSSAFGFTENEVQQLADDYGLQNLLPEMKTWYDGYLFGETEIYNPWSILKFVKSAISGETISCRPYWINTSSNSIIHQLISESDTETKQSIEQLLNGSSIRVPIYEDVVYGNIDVNSSYIWSCLLFTGYLKQVHSELVVDTIYSTMVIPNQEVKSIYKHTIMQWFDENVRKSDTHVLDAAISGDAQQLEDEINNWLLECISYFDGHENYYHGFLAGILLGKRGYAVKSNRESGLGRSDITICAYQTRKIAVIIEVKVASRFMELEQKCDEALKQIEDKKYAEELIEDGYQKTIKYGVAFYGKACKVKMA